MTTKKKRIYLSDVEQICSANDSVILQHPITKHFTLVLNSGDWGWVINPHTDKAIKKLSELSITEWRDVILHTIKIISSRSKGTE